MFLQRTDSEYSLNTKTHLRSGSH